MLIMDPFVGVHHMTYSEPESHYRHRLLQPFSRRVSSSNNTDSEVSLTSRGISDNNKSTSDASSSLHSVQNLSFIRSVIMDQQSSNTMNAQVGLLQKSSPILLSNDSHAPGRSENAVMVEMLMPLEAKAAALRKRNYYGPNESQVMKFVKSQTEKAKYTEGSITVPLPPNTKFDEFGSPIRTVMFKTDYQRRQRQLKDMKAKNAPKSKNTTADILQGFIPVKRKPTLVLAPIPPVVPDVETVVHDDVNKTHPTSNDEQILPTMLIRPPSVQLEDKARKAVKFVPKGEEEEGHGGVSVSKEETVTVDHVGNVTISMERFSSIKEPCISLVKIHKGEKKPRPASAPSVDTEDMKPVVNVRRKSSSNKISVFANNLYDNIVVMDGDYVPENTDVVYHIRRMRTKLQWVCDLPRAGVGCKEAMLKLTRPQQRDTEEEEDKGESDDKRGDGDERKEKEKLIEDPDDDDGDFVYAIQKSRGRYNPYDLIVTSANIARAQSVFWTISASQLTMFSQSDNADDIVTTPVLWWMWEKRLFDIIFDLPFFVNYRLWKNFKFWRMNVCTSKRNKSTATLTKNLYLANDILQGCIIHVRGLCEAAFSSSSTPILTPDSISLVQLDPSRSWTLDDFIDAQRAQGALALCRLNKMMENIIDIVWQSCAKVAEIEGITHGIKGNDSRLSFKDPYHDADRRLFSYNQDEKTGKTKPDKPKRPLFAQIAQWRKILARLASFLRYIDNIIADLLHRIIIGAMNLLYEYLSASFAITDEGDITESETLQIPDSRSGQCSSLSTRSRTFSRNVTPMKDEPKKPAYVIPKYDFSQVEEPKEPANIDKVLDEIKNQDVVIEVPKPCFYVELVIVVPVKTERLRKMWSRTLSAATSHGFHGSRENENKNAVSFANLNDEDDDNISLASSTSAESSDSSASYSDEDQDPVKKNSLYAYTIEHKSNLKTHVLKSYINLSPTIREFKNSVSEIIAGFSETISQIQSLLREPKLAVFYSPPAHELRLQFDEEEMAERREAQRPFPDTELLLGEDVDYQFLNKEIHSLVVRQMEAVCEYTKNFEMYCSMVDRARRVDVEGSMAKRPWTTDEFNHILQTHSDMVAQMGKMQLSSRVSMAQVLTTNFQQNCLPYPRDVIEKVHATLPVIASKRNEQLLNVIKSASRKLDTEPTSVEVFIEHLSFLSRMTSELSALEKEFSIVTRLFTICSDYNIDIVPEEFALYQTLAPSFQHLKSTILYCTAQKDDNIRKFSSELDGLITTIRFSLLDMKNLVRDPKLLMADTIAVVALETINELQEDIHTLSSKARCYASYQDRFGSSLASTRKLTEDYLLMDTKDDKATTYAIQADLTEMERDLALRKLLWESQEEWAKLTAEWTATKFLKLNVDNLQKNVTRFTQTVFMLEKGLPANDVIPKLKDRVSDFKMGMPVISSLRNPALKPRHWDIIERIISKNIVKDKVLTLGQLIDMNIFKHKDKIQDISMTATNEATLEIMLQKVIDLWSIMDFRLVSHPGRDTFLISGADDIMTQLEECQVTIGTIKGSRYVTPIKGLVEEWDRKLSVFNRTLDEWLSCQRNWVYLEQIFNTPDIQRQLPSEYKLFIQVDKSWKEIMRRVEDRPNALKAAIAPGTLETLQSANVNLEKIQKCLEDYLETKRLIFPRFYFLSNDELLDILAQSKDPNAVQPHLGKCFGNIKSLDIKVVLRQPPCVKSMISAEGEVVPMPRNIRARGAVEQWLGSVEVGMVDTVKKHMKLGLSSWSSVGITEWAVTHPGQVVLTVSQVMFNKDVMHCFNQEHPSRALITVHRSLLQILTELAGLVSSSTISPYTRQSIEALLTIDVHNRDILSSLLAQRVSSRDNFEWTRQLRYEWDEQSNNCKVMQSDAMFLYGYEYLGCSPRLVITPLTDRCYLTLTGAMHLHLGGSPAGPAGTGKTETVKDLAKAMGKQCVVFNCSEGLDYKMLGKFFSGLAQSGSWCCFDEFNRIDLEVLSVVASQIHTIKTAKIAGAPRFMFEGRDIRLNMTCGYFITMNPSYAGRVELPDNLKSLFRPVAMMVPDYTLIAEIMLFSEGFCSAKPLSRKLVNLYQLASKQLSQQDHYDFGMRAIKTVLVMAGQGRHRPDISVQNPNNLSEQEESYILINSIIDANIPKFITEDKVLFESIMSDLFPGIAQPEQNQGVLEKAISMAVRDLNLQPWPQQTEQVKQFYKQLLVRTGIMLVGPTGGGKTTVRNITQRAMTLLPTIASQDESDNQVQPFVLNHAKKGHVDTFIVNPKCVKLGELYGETDPNTFEWTDGLIASATRRFAKITNQPHEEAAVQFELTVNEIPTGESRSDVFIAKSCESLSDVPTDWQWIILDGPVDTLWVENLNTVLDDSKILCLASGERISLTPSMRLIFEVDNLSQASPATISRCAMVYLDPTMLGWRPYVKSWLHTLPKDFPASGRRYLLELFEHCIEKGVNFSRRYRSHLMIVIPEMSMIHTLCSILSSILDFMSKSGGGFGKPDKEDQRPGSGDSNFSLGSSRTVGSKGRKKALKRVKREESQMPKENSKPTQRGEGYWYLEKNPHNLNIILGKLFMFSFTWGFGANFKRREDYDEDAYRSNSQSPNSTVNISNEFDYLTRELFEVEGHLGVRLPAGSRSMFSYFVDLQTSNFVTWENLIPSTKSLIEKGSNASIGESLGVSNAPAKKSANVDHGIVPTVDNVRYSFLMALLLLNRQPILLTGESGVGKSAVISHMLKSLCRDGGSLTNQGTIVGDILNYAEQPSTLMESITSLTKFTAESGDLNDLDFILGNEKPRSTTGLISSMIQFSAQTKSARMQAQIISKLVKKGRDVLGAPRGRKVVVFVDDLNMPEPDSFGSQPPLEFLRQFLEYGGFYDLKKLVWKDIMDVTIAGACSPPGGGRNPISSRLLKHFCVLAIPHPSNRSLQHIYQVQLGRFFHDVDFMPDVKECLFPFISASIDIYHRMCANMLPTPTKSHYTFNTRDLSKVIQGLLQANEQVISTKEHCAQLYAHEATRVFHDRLINDDDRLIFYNYLSDNLHDYFKVSWPPSKLIQDQLLFGDFFNVDESDSGTTNRPYKPLNDYKKLSQILEEYYMRKNLSSSGPIKEVVFFEESIQHVARTVRVLRQAQGHMLIVGIDGTGKYTMVDLAAYVARSEVFKLDLHKNYGMEEFRDDLKKVFLKAGVKGHKVVLLLRDRDIVQESFLEDINSILNTGDVPDLFDNEELDGICMELKSLAVESELPDTKEATYEFFIQRVQRNLHIILSMSPAGDTLRQRCRMNPALINCCTIDWYNEWSESAMLSVANMFFSSDAFLADSSIDKEEIKKRISMACVKIHYSIKELSKTFYREMKRHYYLTPTAYLSLLNLYRTILEENKVKCIGNKERLLIGLYKLSEANSLVGSMQEELVSLGPQIEEKARDTEKLLDQLQKDKVAVDEVRVIVEKEETIMQKEADIVQNYADECQQDLASVLPALQSAIAALDALDKASIAEIRVYTKPPELVMTVMAAVCVLFQRKPDWPTAKSLLGDPNFLKKLINFDRNNLPEKVFVKLRNYTRHPDFNPNTVGKVSLACCCICEWVLALEHYNQVYKMVKPKQQRVKEAREALEMARQNLAVKQSSLKKIQDHLAKLQVRYQNSVSERESLKERKRVTGLRIERASVLVSALSDEKVRWSASVDHLETKLCSLTGDTLVATSAITYLGAFTAQYRKKVVGEWFDMCRKDGIPIAEHFNVISSMIDANQELEWQNEGLPHDSHSTENAIFVKKGLKWPLLIDPQGQAQHWIEKMEGPKLKIISVTDGNYMQIVESCVRIGEAILLKGIGEKIDSSLVPLLMQETFQREGHSYIMIGDSEIEYNANFRLYMSTLLSNPHFLPGVFNKANIINFTVTFDGLQEQLLAVVVGQERPLLESQRTELLANIAKDQQLLRDLEDKTLSLLQKSEGHILDDQDLVDTLQKSKVMAGEISVRLTQSAETKKSLNIARTRYLPVAVRGAVIYFVLTDLSRIDVMYAYSLNWFQDMFLMNISPPTTKVILETFPPLCGTIRPRRQISFADVVNEVCHSDDESLDNHLLNMIIRLTSSIYKVVSVSIFAEHQPIFSFMLCTSIMLANDRVKCIDTNIGQISTMEWIAFLQGNVLCNMMTEEDLAECDGLTAIERLEASASRDDTNASRSGPSAWITDDMWRQCQYLQANLPQFHNICRSMIKCKDQWSKFRETTDPFDLMSVPYLMDGHTADDSEVSAKTILAWESLTMFQKLILVKILRPDLLLACSMAFIKAQLGPEYLSTGTFNLNDIYSESTAKTPLIFILSPGSDPVSQLLRFAKKKRGSTLHLDMISLGRGQGPKAEEIISKAQYLKGRWVFLQNCHLAASWMPKLTQIVEGFSKPASEVDPQFRLWLSSKPDPKFPISILQAGMKMTVEPPQGLKANIQRTFNNLGVVTKRVYEECSHKVGWNNLLFGLCLFNGVVHERKKYGALGWNILYEFNDSDLEVSLLQLQNLISEQNTIMWDAINYLTGEVTFGGRVTDELDRRCLRSLLRRFYSIDVLSPDYSYSADKTYMPVSGEMSYEDVLAYIETLPNYDPPEIFGMTNNAEKAFQETQGKNLVDIIINVQPKVTAQFLGISKNKDDIVYDITSEIIAILPEVIGEYDELRKMLPGLLSHESITIKTILAYKVNVNRIKEPVVETKDSAETPGNARFLATPGVRKRRHSVGAQDGTVVDLPSLQVPNTAPNALVVPSNSHLSAHSAPASISNSRIIQPETGTTCAPMQPRTADPAQPPVVPDMMVSPVVPSVPSQQLLSPPILSDTTLANISLSQFSSLGTSSTAQKTDACDTVSSHRVCSSLRRLSSPDVPVNHSQLFKAVSDANVPHVIEAMRIEDIMGQSALITVLRQEVDRFNTLLSVIHKSVRDLKLAVKGEMVLSGQLEDTFFSLLHQKVPQDWKSVSYEANLTLGAWIQDLVRRIDFFTNWADLVAEKANMILKSVQPHINATNMQPETDPNELVKLQPRSFWLSAFFFPQGFLTAVLQNHARRAKVSVDRLQFKCKVKPTSHETEDRIQNVAQFPDIKEVAFKGKAPPVDGVLVCGLILDGARWDLKHEILMDSHAGCRHCFLPEVHFEPFDSSLLHDDNLSRQTSVSTIAPRNETSSYECPVYRTAERAGTLSSTGHSTNFVTTINLPSRRHPDFWIMRGVALICQLNK